MEGEYVADVGIARVFFPHSLRIGEHGGDFPVKRFAPVGQVNGIIVGFAHFPAVDAQQLRHLGQKRLRNGKDVFLVKVVEAPGDFAGQLNVGKLVHADRNAVGLVHDNVGRLQNGVAQKAEGGKIFGAQFRLHFLVGGIAREPGQRRDHGKQQEQFGVFLDRRLHKEGAFGRIEAGGQPVHHHIQAVLPNVLCRCVFTGDRMPIGDEVKAVVVAAVLQFDPVPQRAVQISKVQPSCGPHPAENPFSCQARRSSFPKWINAPRPPVFRKADGGLG